MNRQKCQNIDEIIRLHRPRIFRFVLALIRDENLAEDLTQDCFWRAYQGWPEFRGDSNVHTWLRQIALNVVRNFVRSDARQRWQCFESTDTIDEGFLKDRVNPCPETRAVIRNTVQSIWNAAEELSPKQQRVLRLRFVEDLQISEIAAAMDVAEGSVKAHLSRAVKSIRETLQVS